MAASLWVAVYFYRCPQTTTTILRSAIKGNETIGGAGILTAGPVYLQNVTVADNVATTTAPRIASCQSDLPGLENQEN